MIKIKFLKNVPSNDTIKEWVETWECFHFPDIVIYKKDNIVLIDNSGIDQSTFVSSIFWKIIALKDTWISGDIIHDLQQFSFFDTDGDTFQCDYRLFLEWKDNYNKMLLSRYNILKNLDASLEYIRFALKFFPFFEFEKIVDKTWNPTEEEIVMLEAIDNDFGF